MKFFRKRITMRELIWAVILYLCSLIIAKDPIQNRFLYLSAVVVCELWILFRLPGAKYLWMDAKNSGYPNYREIRIISVVFLWFLLIALPRECVPLVYCIFAICFEKILIRVFRIPPKKWHRVVEKGKTPKTYLYWAIGVMLIPTILVILVGIYLWFAFKSGLR